MRNRVLSALCAIALMATAAISNAELMCYMQLKGQKQGDIKGSVIQKGREGLIAVLSVNHEIISPRDPASGLPTGKRMHKPFTVRIGLDQSAPLLYNALTQNENLSNATFKFYMNRLGAISGVGTESNLFNIVLTNASIASIRLVSEDDAKAPGTALQKTNAQLEVSFTYQKIAWTWVDGGITSQDDWEAPVN
jgi:type VI secretion system secreted protein Hcp